MTLTIGIEPVPGRRAGHVQPTSEGGERMKVYDCPKFASCNAPVCPLYGEWRKTRHLRGEPTCLFLREAAKAAGEARLRALLPPDLADPILSAYQEITTSQECTGDNGFGELRRKLQAAGTRGSKLEAGDRLERIHPQRCARGRP